MKCNILARLRKIVRIPTYGAGRQRVFQTQKSELGNLFNTLFLYHQGLNSELHLTLCESDLSRRQRTSSHTSWWLKVQ